jgi:hypothetical protein
MSADVYKHDAFTARVNYAAQCFMRGTRSRRFDGCFEMFDGEAVVTALVRRARKNPRLCAAIARGWSDLKDGLPVLWVETAERYAHHSDLSALASELRTKAKGAAS